MIDDLAALAKLAHAAPGAFLRRSVKIELKLGIREDNAPLVAPFGNQVGPFPADTLLLLDKLRPDGGDHRDIRCGSGRLGAAQQNARRARR